MNSRPASTVFQVTAEVRPDTIFVTVLHLDLASHGFVIDAQGLTPLECMVHKVIDTLTAIHTEARLIRLYRGEVVVWKRLLPAFAEWCRTWKHGGNCKYLGGREIQLSLEYDGDPLCSCGKGKDVTSKFRKEKVWSSAIPYVTRIAISPLYGVPYMKNVSRFTSGLAAAKTLEPEKWCQKCGGLGKPKLFVCSRCKGASDYSTDCQKVDWKTHKGTCHK